MCNIVLPKIGHPGYQFFASENSIFRERLNFIHTQSSWSCLSQSPIKLNRAFYNYPKIYSIWIPILSWFVYHTHIFQAAWVTRSPSTGRCQASQRLGRLESALQALKPQIEARTSSPRRFQRADAERVLELVGQLLNQHGYWKLPKIWKWQLIYLLRMVLFPKPC